MNRADDTTPRASVPADIDAPDTIVWGLTFRQLAILAVAAHPASLPVGDGVQ